MSFISVYVINITPRTGTARQTESTLLSELSTHIPSAIACSGRRVESAGQPAGGSAGRGAAMRDPSGSGQCGESACPLSRPIARVPAARRTGSPLQCSTVTGLTSEPRIKPGSGASSKVTSTVSTSSACRAAVCIASAMRFWYA